jgi:hypothetical protein
LTEFGISGQGILRTARLSTKNVDRAMRDSG